MKRSYLIHLVLLLGAGLPAQDEPYGPERAAETMRVPEGFTVTVFASEPAVLQPTALCIDDRGRLWVAENHSYPVHTAEAAADRIVILEDVDGDGRHDRRTVFHDGLNYVTGIELGFGGVYVMSPPHFLFIPDRDRDDVPDEEPKVMLDGFGNFANSHNLANNLAWGPDGWLYGTHGRTNWSKIGRPGSADDERRVFDGGVWRYHPTEDRWESYLDGCTNPWGIDWDDYGQAFIPNTVDPHLFHAIQGAHYDPWRNRESSRFAYERIKTIADHLHYLGGSNYGRGVGTEEESLLGGGHSHCGILVYLGDQWPARYRNTVLLHNTHGKRINNDRLVRSGSGYVATHDPDFLQVEDPWFMGVNFRTGPDGSVFVTDGSDTGECHSTRNTRKHTGRIYRISYGDAVGWSGNLADSTQEELVQLQLHPNDWFVRHARRILQERRAGQVSPQLRKILDDHEDVTRQLRALWALWAVDGVNQELLLELLASPEEHLRAWSVRLLGESLPLSAAALRLLETRARSDQSALVRLHLASVLQRIEPPRRWVIVESLLSHVEDAADQNLPLMIWYGTEPLVHQDPVRFARLAETSEIPKVRKFIARRLASLPKGAEDGVGDLLRISHENPAAARDILQGLLQGWEGRSSIPAPKAWADFSPELYQQRELALLATSLGTLFGDPAALARLLTLATGDELEPDDRRTALGRYVRAAPKGWERVLIGCVDFPELRSAALLLLARAGDNAETEVSDYLLSRYPGFEGVARAAAIQSLASRPDWAERLLGELREGRLASREIPATTALQIARFTPEHEAQIRKLWGDVRPTPQEKEQQITRLVRQLGDAVGEADLKTGRRLFMERCSACHRVQGEGRALGPDLAGSQRSSLQYLVENVIDPSASVPAEHRLVTLELHDGQLLSGFVGASTETTITLQTLTGEQVVSRQEIAKQTALPVSFMPEGLLTGLSQEELRDLFGFLQRF